MKFFDTLIWRIWRWWFRFALLIIPFGIIYSYGRMYHPAQEKPIFWVCIVGAMLVNYLVQGAPPEE